MSVCVDKNGIIFFLSQVPFPLQTSMTLCVGLDGQTKHCYHTVHALVFPPNGATTCKGKRDQGGGWVGGWVGGTVNNITICATVPET